MAQVFFGMNMSLDGFVNHDHPAMLPDAELFRYFIDQMGDILVSVYGRKLYELMQYWDEDDAAWPADYLEFAVAWRKIPKIVASTSLTRVGPNAQLVRDDIAGVVRDLKAKPGGQIEVGGTQLAQHLGEAGLIDEYHIFLHPVVMGSGTPFFAGSPPPLRLIGHERIGQSYLRLSYGPISSGQ
jgi:dihydrofolate reductase